LFFPVALSMMVVAPFGGRLSDRIGVRKPVTFGLILISVVVFSFQFLEGTVHEYQIIWRQLLLGAGLGLFAPANNSAIIGSLPRDKVGLAASFSALSRNMGMVVGVAVAEMVIALRSLSGPPEGDGGIPSLVSLHDVWKLALLIGLGAALLSWVRGDKSEREVNVKRF